MTPDHVPVGTLTSALLPRHSIPLLLATYVGMWAQGSLFVWSYGSFDGSPIDWSEHGPDAADDPEVLQRCYDEITSLMQSTLDQLAAENPRPIAARLKKVLRR